MDKLGQQIVDYTARASLLRKEAAKHEELAANKRRQADEIERLLELARLQR